MYCNNSNLLMTGHLYLRGRLWVGDVGVGWQGGWGLRRRSEGGGAGGACDRLAKGFK